MVRLSLVVPTAMLTLTADGLLKTPMTPRYEQWRILITAASRVGSRQHITSLMPGTCTIDVETCLQSCVLKLTTIRHHRQWDECQSDIWPGISHLRAAAALKLQLSQDVRTRVEMQRGDSCPSLQFRRFASILLSSIRYNRDRFRAMRTTLPPATIRSGCRRNEVRRTVVAFIPARPLLLEGHPILQNPTAGEYTNSRSGNMTRHSETFRWRS